MNAINQRTRRALSANPARQHSNAPRNMPIRRLETLADFEGVLIRFDLKLRSGDIREYQGVVLGEPFHHTYEGIDYVWFCVKAQRIAEPFMIADTQLRGFVNPFIGLKEVE